MTTLNNVVLFVVVLVLAWFVPFGSVSDSDGLLSFDSFGSDGLLSLPFGSSVVEAAQPPQCTVSLENYYLDHDSRGVESEWTVTYHGPLRDFDISGNFTWRVRFVRDGNSFTGSASAFYSIPRNRRSVRFEDYLWYGYNTENLQIRRIDYDRENYCRDY